MNFAISYLFVTVQKAYLVFLLAILTGGGKVAKKQLFSCVATLSAVRQTPNTISFSHSTYTTIYYCTFI